MSAPLSIAALDRAEALDGTASHQVVRLENLSKRFGTTPALHDVSLTVRRGEVLGLIGRSGAGKSTLIRCLNGLERPDSGLLEIDGRSIVGLSERQLQPLRRSVGMIFQHFNLLSAKTVVQNIALPLKIAGQSRKARQARVAELLDLVGLADKADVYPAQLSGGQKQRVGIVRALAARPALLLSDEATSALDPETTDAILTLLKDINRHLGLTILLITHEMGVVRAIADRVAVLDRGRIVEEGPVWQVFAAPQSSTTKSLLRAYQPSLPKAVATRLVAGVGRSTIVKVVALGSQAREPLLAGLALDVGIRAALLHGGVEFVQQRAIGAFFIELDGRDAKALANALAYFSARAHEVELLGHVVADD
jgi:D-methionine transport system ATP-binding protein